MSSLYKKLFTQTLFYGIAAIFPKFIHYFFLRTFTRELKISEFSLYSDMYALSFLVISFLSFGLETTYFRFLYKNPHKEDKETFFSNALFVLFLFSSVFVLLGYSFSSSIAHFLDYDNHREYVIMFFWIIFFDVICALPFAWLRSKGKALEYGLIRIANACIFSLLIFIFFNLYNSQKWSYLISWLKNYTDKTGLIFFTNIINSFTNFIFLIPIFLKLKVDKIALPIIFNMLHYGGAIMLGSLSFALNENVGKIFIRRVFSEHINGAYGACYKIAAIMSLHVSVFRLGVEPFFFKGSQYKNAKEIYNEVNYFFVLTGCLLYVFVYSNLKIIARILINPNYYEALKIVPIILMANLFLGIYNNLSISYKLVGKPYMGTYFSFIGVIITLFFNFLLFIPGAHFNLSAWGTLCSYGMMVVISYFWGKKNYLIEYEIKPLIRHLIGAFLVGYILYDLPIFFNISGQLIYIIFIAYIERKRIKIFLYKEDKEMKKQEL